MTNMDPTQLKAQATRRRDALVTAGCSTYLVSVDYAGEPLGILCLCCGQKSYNPEDITNRYCGFCHEFHSEWVNEP
jgi:ribosomal protein L37E